MRIQSPESGADRQRGRLVADDLDDLGDCGRRIGLVDVGRGDIELCVGM